MKDVAMYEFAADATLSQSSVHDGSLGQSVSFTAVVLAGSRSEDCPVAAIGDTNFKALVPIYGKPMIARVVEALAESQLVGRIVVVFDEPDALVKSCPWLFEDTLGMTVSIVPCQETICSSVEKALEAEGCAWPFLVTTADHALLTPEMVDRFCGDAIDAGSLSVGFVEKKYLDAAHPGSKRTYLPFRETKLSGANLFAFIDEAAVPVLDFWRDVEAKRKKPWQLFKAFGYRNLIGLLLRRYTVNEAFARASKVLGVTAGAVRLPFAEAAIDVDTAKDYQQVTRILSKRAEAGDFSATALPGKIL